ncbi:MAG: NUDIX domain-containing protein [Planctomycetes bacterium]|nr:NUDIX domain-containing protein [Planctomycetota bacterium]
MKARGPLDPRFVAEVRSRLLEKWNRGHRDLPWRRRRDAYAILVAEVMLQQTRVETVVPYYERFLRAFPNLRALARAPLPRVLAAWSGLGYYRRARMLREAARTILSRHGGRFPETYEEVRALPGVGRYTAGALLSIAFGKPFPVLDGNVARVLSRLLALRGDPRRNADRLWSVAASLVPPRAPGEFNQALMELGALLCAARAPRCPACPLRTGCAARQGGGVVARPAKSRERERPVRQEGAESVNTPPAPPFAPSRSSRFLASLRGSKAANASGQPAPRTVRAKPRGKRRPPAAVPVVDVAVAAIWRGDEYLVARRPLRPGTHLPGCWEFPGGKRRPGESARACLKREVAEELGVEIAVRPEFLRLSHRYEDRIVRLTAHRCRILSGVPRATGGQDEIRWVAVERLGALRFPPANRPILERLLAFRRSRSAGS